MNRPATVAEIDRHKLYCRAEVMQILRVSYASINRMVKNGAIAHRLVGRMPRIPGAAIERFLMLDIPEPTPEPLPAVTEVETRAQRQRRAQDALSQIPGCSNRKGEAS